MEVIVATRFQYGRQRRNAARVQLEVNQRDLFTKTIDMQRASMRGDPLGELAHQTLPTPGQLFDGHVNAP